VDLALGLALALDFLGLAGFLVVVDEEVSFLALLLALAAFLGLDEERVVFLTGLFEDPRLLFPVDLAFSGVEGATPPDELEDEEDDFLVDFLGEEGAVLIVDVEEEDEDEDFFLSFLRFGFNL